jgi:hypothetical protein
MKIDYGPSRQRSTVANRHVCHRLYVLDSGEWRVVGSSGERTLSRREGERLDTYLGRQERLRHGRQGMQMKPNKQKLKGW